MEKSVQYIQQIPYQMILDFRDELERLRSWEPYLLTIQRYFSNQSVSVNKKVIAKKYYACSKWNSLFIWTVILKKDIKAKRKQ